MAKLLAKLSAKYKLILKTSVLILIKIQFIDIPVWICQSVKSMIKCSSSTKPLFSVPHEYMWTCTIQWKWLGKHYQFFS